MITPSSFMVQVDLVSSLKMNQLQVYREGVDEPAAGTYTAAYTGACWVARLAWQLLSTLQLVAVCVGNSRCVGNTRRQISVRIVVLGRPLLLRHE